MTDHQDNFQYTAVVFAAGKGTRMNSKSSKVMHKLLGWPMLRYTSRALLSKRSYCREAYFVLGHCMEEVKAELDFSHAIMVEQKEQKGTGDAFRCAYEKFSPQAHEHPVVVVNGDMPLVTGEVVQRMLERHQKSQAALTVGVMETPNPKGYGRVISSSEGWVTRIVEEREATEEERALTLVNGGIYVVEPRFLKTFLPKLVPSTHTGEWYFTNLIALGADAGERVASQNIPGEYLMGVNDLEQLAEVSMALRLRRFREWLKKGVQVIDPRHTYIDMEVDCAPGVVIEPHAYIYGNTKLEKGAHIESGVRLQNVVIGAGARIRAHSYLEDCQVGREAVVGPMARVRAGTTIGKGTKIGNFVELKNSAIGEHTKINHLSYVGDAQVGKNTNIGCGFITCNYDGVKKHKTTIGDQVFIGSDVQTIAPITIGTGAYVAAGSTIDKDILEGAFAIARSRQTNKEGLAQKLLDKNRK